MGFLSNLLGRFDEEDPNLPTFRDEEFAPGYMPEERAVAPAAAPKRSLGQTATGLLKDAGKWAMSPEGRLAIGTTLRAGGGNEDAFADQSRIQARMDKRKLDDRATAAQRTKNDGFLASYDVDEKTGKRTYNPDKFRDYMAANAPDYEGDLMGDMKAAKDLRDQYSIVSTGRGGAIGVNPQNLADRQTIRESDPEHTEFDPGKVYLRPKVTPGPGATPAPTEALPGPGTALVPAAPAAPTDQLLNRTAISAGESRGKGGYAAVGPVTKRGDRAYGKYQVMGANIPQWTEEVLGRRMTPQQFLLDEQGQDKVFDTKFGEFATKYGSPEEAASVWFTGRPLAQGANRRDVLGTTGAEYVDKFKRERAAAGGGAGAPTGDARTAAVRSAPAAADPFAGLPPPPEGYEYFSVGAKPGEKWENVGNGIQRNLATGETKSDGAPRDGAGGGALSSAPAAVRTVYSSNSAALEAIRGARELVKQNPKAFGWGNVADKAVVGGIPVGEIGMNAQRSDTDKQALAAVGRLAAITRHDLSGAAVTMSEQPYLKPFLPNPYDNPQTVLSKLDQLEAHIGRENAVYEQQYGGGLGASQGGAPVQVRSPEEARSLPPGTVFVTPDGRQKVAR